MRNARGMRRRWLAAAALVLALAVIPALAAGAGQGEEEKWIDCGTCGASGVCMTCYGRSAACEDCGGSGACPDCGGTGQTAPPSRFYDTPWALLPPVVAIALALITKEAYLSLFIGIVVGGLLYSGFSFEGTVLHVMSGGIAASLSNTYNVGILVFLVMLGALVCMMNAAGGSAAFGRWAGRNIKTRWGAQLASVGLGIAVFIDDYFNCLTVGSVMRPITDRHRISRAKLAYLIDATAAPICIIAPISSWAAAVAGFAGDGKGLELFIRAIPYNFYALFTVVMMVGMILLKVEFGPMAVCEENARERGDLFSGAAAAQSEPEENEKGRVADLAVPILALVACCVAGMLYSGGFFSGVGFVEAFSGSDASVGLMLGSTFGLLLAVVYYLLRRTLSLRRLMECLPEGFKAMVPAILILTLAWSLKGMTDSLGAREFVAEVVKASAGAFQMFLPAIIFLIACVLAFATGTSWGTFGILIPIVQGVFPLSDPLGIICISACMAGAVCGDHCSPISDTTIMASAGAGCEHVLHVSTQLPYAVTCAGVSFVSYVLAGALAWAGVSGLIALPVGAAGMVGVLLVLRQLGRRSAKTSG